MQKKSTGKTIEAYRRTGHNLLKISASLIGETLLTQELAKNFLVRSFINERSFRDRQKCDFESKLLDPNSTSEPGQYPVDSIQ